MSNRFSGEQIARIVFIPFYRSSCVLLVGFISTSLRALNPKSWSSAETNARYSDTQLMQPVQQELWGTPIEVPWRHAQEMQEDRNFPNPRVSHALRHGPHKGLGVLCK